MNIKDKIETIQVIITIAAVVVGGFWTYSLFIKERENYPHANIEHKVSHVQLSKDTILLRVSIVVTNTGNSRLVIKKSDIRIQQILPLTGCVENYPCAEKQINEALQKRERTKDRFSWPMIARRLKPWEIPLDIEPSEKDEIDFEFVIPSDVTTIRIYSYFRNEEKTTHEGEVGWIQSSYYKLKEGIRKK